MGPRAGRPELVQFGDLTPGHFERHPVWVQCHVVDYDEPWYDDTDEETFRPWLEPLPADHGDGMLLVRADFILADGTRLQGFVTPLPPLQPAKGDDALGYQQPQLFLPSGQRRAFWYGGMPVPAEDKDELYTALGRAVAEVFPIRFEAQPGLTTGITAGTLAGFYHRSHSWFRSRVVVER